MNHLKNILIVFTLVFNNYTYSQSLYPLSPKFNSVKTENLLLFKWSNVPNTQYYNIQVALDSLFANLVIDSINIYNTQINMNLSSNRYFWRIRSFNTIYSNWSETQIFTILDFNTLGTLTQHFISDSNVIQNSGIIDKWNDISGNNIEAIQTNSSEKPIVVGNALNGQPAIRFDGNDDNLLINSSAKVGSLFIVANYLGGTVFPNYNGLFNHQSSTIIFTGEIGTTKLLYNFSPYFDTNMYINTELQNQCAPLNNFKIICGINPLPITLSNFVIASDRGNASRYWNGDYLEIIMFEEALSDSSRALVEQYLRFKYAPPIDLGPPINLVCDTFATLSLPDYFSNIVWSTGDTTNSITLYQSDTISVQATDVFGFQSSDTIILTTFQNKFNLNVISDTTTCGNYVLWDTGLDSLNYSFLWSNGVTTSFLNIDSTGNYAVTAIDTSGCAITSEVISILIDSFSTQTTLGIDKIVCQGATLGLETGIGATSYLWNTNDTTVQIVIDTTGNYWVQVVNNNGCIANDTIQITVNGTAPTVNFNIQDNCVNKTVAFNNTSFTTDGSNIINWNWNFGNGDTSAIQNPQLNFASAGLYNVTLQIQTDSGCSNTLIQQVQVHEKPAAGFFPSSTLLCSSQNSFFTENSFSSDGTINSWFWDFGTTASTDTSSIQNGYYSYSTLGNYSVKLIVSTQFGCLDTVSHIVNIKPSPTANFIFQDSCLTNQTKFINSSTGSISITNWDFGDANSSTLINPFHVYSASGNYNVVLAIKATNSCWDTLIKPLHIYDNPTTNFVTDKYCVGSNYQLFDSSSTVSGLLTNWNWTISGLNFQSTNQNPLINFNLADSGTFQVKLNVINGFGCKDSITKTMSVYPLPDPNFDFSPEIGLPPLLVNFNNQTYGGNSYQWNFGDGNSSVDFSPIYTFQDSGIFNITLSSTSLYGCIDSIAKTIQIVEPVIDLAIKNIFYEFLPNSNFMKMSVQLANLGRVTIKNIDLLLQNSSTGTILESWNGSLAPNMQNIYTFTSLIEMPNGEIPSLICVNASNINHGVDANLLNNEFCKTLNKFELISLYPNPISKYLYLEFISPEASSLEINLFDNTGNVVSTLFSGQSSKGLNRINFLMSIYSQGLYVLEIKNKEEIIRKKIVVN